LNRIKKLEYEVVKMNDKKIKNNNHISFEEIKEKAGQGDSEAQFILSRMYRFDENVEKNGKLAFYWVEKAALQGHYRAQADLADYYDWHNDYENGVYWCKKAAEQGSEYACNSLAAYYLTGVGVKQDFEKALDYFEKSNLQHYAAKFNFIDKCGDRGKKLDIEKALLWIENEGTALDKYKSKDAFVEALQMLDEHYKEFGEW